MDTKILNGLPGITSQVLLELEPIFYKPRKWNPSGLPPVATNPFKVFFMKYQGYNATPVWPTRVQKNYKCYLKGQAEDLVNNIARNPIIVRAAPCERPILDGNGMFKPIKTHPYGAENGAYPGGLAISQTAVLEMYSDKDDKSNDV